MMKKIKGFFKKIRMWLKKLWCRHRFKIIVVTLILSFFVAYLWRNIFFDIESGEAGVMWKRFHGGTVMDTTFGEGLHVIYPWDKMIIYSVRTQARRESIKILTQGGLYVEMDISYRFHPERKSLLPYLHRIWGPDYVEKFVQPEAKAAVIAVLGDQSPKQLYSINTTEIQDKIEAQLDTEFEDSYIVLQDFLITRLQLPKTISDAIEQKLTQEQLHQEYAFRLNVAEQEKKRKEIEAQGIKLFEETSGIPILKWRGLEVTSEIARSNNTKVVIVGTGQQGLPIILNADK